VPIDLLNKTNPLLLLQEKISDLEEQVANLLQAIEQKDAEILHVFNENKSLIDTIQKLRDPNE